MKYRQVALRAMLPVKVMFGTILPLFCWMESRNIVCQVQSMQHVVNLLHWQGSYGMGRTACGHICYTA